jgi:twitching motility protein PilT
VAQLDPLLKALRDRNANELVLKDGHQPVFGTSDGARPVSPKVLTRPQIIALLCELAGPLDAVKLKGGESIKFSYTLADSGPFEIGVATAGVFCVTVHAAAAPEPELVGVAAAVPNAVAPPAAAAIDPAMMPKPHAAQTAADPAVIPDLPAQTAVAVSDPVMPAGIQNEQADVTQLPQARSAAEGTHKVEMERYLRQMFEMDASDLHLSPGEVPMVRLHGEMARLEGEQPLSANQTQLLLDSIMPERNRKEFFDCNDTDYAHEIPDVARFRVNVFKDRKGVGGVFRTIPTKILTAEQLGLPPAILNLCNLSKGLVLVTGPTGSGKSTTLAAMIDYINKTRTDHIITIEDPIEFVHPNQKCLVNQREIPTHTTGFKKALRAALREDPDIVLVGEMRDLETIAIAIETAETGHLVFGTLHTTTAISTVDRIIDQFPADRQAQIRTMLSESIRGVVAQTLLKKNGGGRVAALEVLIVNSAISNLIREGKTFQIASLMQTGKKLGMQMLNDSLLDLIKKKIVDPNEAYVKAVDKASFLSACKTNNIKINLPANKSD